MWELAPTRRISELKQKKQIICMTQKRTRIFHLKKFLNFKSWIFMDSAVVVALHYTRTVSENIR